MVSTFDCNSRSLCTHGLILATPTWSMLELLTPPPNLPPPLPLLKIFGSFKTSNALLVFAHLIEWIWYYIHKLKIRQLLLVNFCKKTNENMVSLFIQFVLVWLILFLIDESICIWVVSLEKIEPVCDLTGSCYVLLKEKQNLVVSFTTLANWVNTR